MIDYAKMTRNLFRDNPSLEKRIATGIEQNRKGDFLFKLVDRTGIPVPNATVRYNLLRHEFKFGCNAFLLDAFDSDEKNELHDRIFADTFNLAVLPFYWKDLEPEKGQYRYSADSPKIYRRPPPDRVLEFCRQHHITPKGHVLCWHLFLPEWLEKDPETIRIELERRIRSLAERYGDSIRIWDVVNEAVGYDGKIPMPQDFVRLAFELANRYFPKHCKLMYNDNNWSYSAENTPLYRLLRRLRSEGCRLDGLGLQYHMFAHGTAAENLANDMLDPEYVLKVLDLDASVGVPIDISEVTILGSDELKDGESAQTQMLDRLYRLWFSHPAIKSIIYWNLADDCTFVRPGWNENIFKGGLLRQDLSPKKAFITLQNLLRKEWHSAGTLEYSDETVNTFHGFYGEYELEIQGPHGHCVKTVHLRKSVPAAESVITVETTG
ncbi:MAG: Endo-1,4-beta-xylanase precursor [Lentisphaerae bacterium ADurb.Bin242]|nr:MAG: Endo-1,4-beta-xylanase precursor [Lentisphaerae bacterium ADurb.Bin242]